MLSVTNRSVPNPFVRGMQLRMESWYDSVDDDLMWVLTPLARASKPLTSIRDIYREPAIVHDQSLRYVWKRVELYGISC